MGGGGSGDGDDAAALKPLWRGVWAKKKGDDAIGAWKARFCVLLSDRRDGNDESSSASSSSSDEEASAAAQPDTSLRLEYRTASAPGTAAQGQIALPAVKAVRAVAGHATRFDVEVVQPSARVFHFDAADSAAPRGAKAVAGRDVCLDRDAWVAGLQAAIRRAQGEERRRQHSTRTKAINAEAELELPSGSESESSSSSSSAEPSSDSAAPAKGGNSASSSGSDGDDDDDHDDAGSDDRDVTFEKSPEKNTSASASAAAAAATTASGRKSGGVGRSGAYSIGPDDDITPTLSKKAAAAADKYRTVTGLRPEWASAQEQPVQIRVHVIEARDLQPRDSNGMSDPVATVVCAGKKQHTSTLKETTTAAWDHLFFFEKDMTRSRFEQEAVSIRIFDANTIRRDVEIGSFDIGLETVYCYDPAVAAAEAAGEPAPPHSATPPHEIFRRWVPLADSTGKFTGCQGYVKVSITVLVGADQAPVHDDDDEMDEAGDDASDSQRKGKNALQGLLLTSPHIKTQPMQLEVNAYRATHLAAMDRNGKSDPYVSVQFGGGRAVKTEVVKNTLTPDWNEALTLAVSSPTLADTITVRCSDWDLTHADDVIGTVTFSWRDLLESDGFSPRWFHLYGSPTSVAKDILRHPELRRLARRMDMGAAPGSTYRGSLLLGATAKKVAKTVVPGKHKISTVSAPRQRQYMLRCELHEGREIVAAGLGKVCVRITCGSTLRTQSPAAKCKNGNAEWYTVFKDTPLALTDDPDQRPDLFVELVGNKMMDTRRLAYVRIPMSGRAERRVVRRVPVQRSKKSKKAGATAAAAAKKKKGKAKKGKKGKQELASDDDDDEEEDEAEDGDEVEYEEVVEVVPAKVGPPEHPLLEAMSKGQPQWVELVPDVFDAHGQDELLQCGGFLRLRLSIAETVEELGPRPQLAAPETRAYQLRAHLYSAVDLPAGDEDGTSDPYAIVTCAGARGKSRVVKDTNYPSWFETVVLDDVRLPIDPESRPAVHVRVKDHDFIGRHDFLGRFSADATELGRDPTPPEWFPLVRSRGSDLGLSSATTAAAAAFAFGAEAGGRAGGQAARDAAAVGKHGRVLASFQLIPMTEAAAVPLPSLVPASRKCTLDLGVLGIRDVLPYLLVPLQKPRVEFHVASIGHDDDDGDNDSGGEHFQDYQPSAAAVAAAAAAAAGGAGVADGGSDAKKKSGGLGGKLGGLFKGSGSASSSPARSKKSGGGGGSSSSSSKLVEGVSQLSVSTAWVATGVAARLKGTEAASGHLGALGSTAASVSCNFVEDLELSLRVPEDPMFAPALNVRVVDDRGLKKRVVATRSIPLAPFLPWADHDGGAGPGALVEAEIRDGSGGVPGAADGSDDVDDAAAARAAAAESRQKEAARLAKELADDVSDEALETQRQIGQKLGKGAGKIKATARFVSIGGKHAKGKKSKKGSKNGKNKRAAVADDDDDDDDGDSDKPRRKKRGDDDGNDSDSEEGAESSSGELLEDQSDDSTDSDSDAERRDPLDRDEVHTELELALGNPRFPLYTLFRAAENSVFDSGAAQTFACGGLRTRVHLRDQSPKKAQKKRKPKPKPKQKQKTSSASDSEASSSVESSDDDNDVDDDDEDDDDARPDIKTLFAPRRVVARINVLTGYNLVPHDKHGNNPYLRLYDGHKHTVIKDLQKDKQGTSRPQFYKSYDIPLNFPKDSSVTVEVIDWDKIGADELIGSTTINLEHRMLSRTWNRQKRHPIEHRSLWVPSSRSPQGVLKLWVDVLTAEDAHATPPPALAPPLPVQAELRVIIWNTSDTAFKDKNSSDIFVSVVPESQPGIDAAAEAQVTDTHWRSEDGNGMFNWRMKFPVSLPTEWPRLKISVWDKDVISANDAIAEAVLNLRGLYKEFYRDHEKSQIVEIPKCWVAMTHSGAEDEGSIQSRVQMSIQLMTLDEAARRPAGFGRKAPNALPEPNRPDTSFGWWRADKYVTKVFWRANKGKFYIAAAVICCVIILIFVIWLAFTLGPLL